MYLNSSLKQIDYFDTGMKEIGVLYSAETFFTGNFFSRITIKVKELYKPIDNSQVFGK